ncbi:MULTISPECIES: AAA domain-containing protein [unclassified Pseudomonas]|uniref:AAA domain-containing protein n=1 Tax=unclassified Pseudomonas TaxID=196821 RepID=UPI000F568534|nr:MULTISPECIES: AAA domain-containing protein [unclassified Pseudomonas]AZF48111.1 Putative superfamily I DNA helicase [Pseudomonas sp. R2-7-07]AZF58616.1 Putative superfamily I DNA helicase [Pseudomonas sp. R11-23-07]
MNDYSLKLANYWRTSLADAENGNGALSPNHVKTYAAVPLAALAAGCLPVEQVESLFAGEPAQLLQVEVTLRPFVYASRQEHRQARNGLPAFITPIICRVSVTRDGLIYPTGPTLVPRDILEPLDRDNFTIGAQHDLDTFLTAQDAPQFEPPPAGTEVQPEHYREQWITYLRYCKTMFQTVCNAWNGVDDGFDPVNYCYVFKEQKAEGFSRNIVALYDHLRLGKPDAPLFERFAQRERMPDEPCLAANSLFAGRGGHAGDEYALAPAQRDSLAHLLAGNAGDILAVNGPPGTGKTTLLLSVVASLWAKAAAEGGEPPVIVASSTNNQAVTNIIKAFGKDFSAGTGPFAGRWLPDINSFGAYFPKAAAEAEMARTYQTKSFYLELETQAYLDKAQQAYLEHAAIAFPGPSQPTLKGTVDKLQALIQLRQQQLGDIEKGWARLNAARDAMKALLGDNPYTAIAALEGQCRAQSDQLASAKARLKDFKHYLAHESLIYTLFGWFGPIAAKRLRLAKLHIDETDAQLQSANDVHEIERLLTAAVAHTAQSLKILETQRERVEHLRRDEQRELLNWQAVIGRLPNAVGKPAAEVTLEDCDRWADTSLRFETFLLTTHYWEGRWLLEVADELPLILKSRKKNGRKTLEKNWRRWMKLTPCVVATFYRLPAELSCSRRDGNGYVADYALNFIDLLIVDEAGQVLPEVAAPSFALARQALVIGDTQQIEPIWSVPPSVDIGNLLAAGLLSRSRVDDEYEAFCDSGRSAASGSVMAIAQSTSRYHYDRDLARGLYLYEHRRCYDSIIDYCNALCYKGKLQPRRGAKPQGGLPGLGYLHIDGLCQQKQGGSRHNLLEAQTIAAWIKANEQQLTQRYNKELWEILGVITPFGAQTQAITEACAALGIRTGKGDGEMTVGTVHSFQGAERPVVIFSAVYSKHADGAFIDRRDSMLNVAVSRAKDSFLVFGDMDLFSQIPASKPRGRLAQYLLNSADNALTFDFQPRADLLTARTGLSHLHEFAEHDQFLLQTLETAQQQVQIVTPWVRLRGMRESGALEAMCGTVQRGVPVTVYTDLHFNTGIGRSKSDGDPGKVAEFKDALATLKHHAVQVRVVNKVHSKLVMADEALLCVGSFNWLSAARSGDYVHHETSMVYRGPDVSSELAINRTSLAQRLISREL